MIQTTNGYLNLGDGKLYYETAGDGSPLVLAHAGFVDSRMWDDQWQALAQHYRVIRFDLQGFGKSDPLTAPVSRRDELYQLLRQLGVARAAFIGCSLSGETVLDFALEHPAMVSALIIVSAVPGGFELQGEPPPHLMEMFGALQSGDLTLASELQNRIWIDGSFRQPEQVDPVIRQRAAEMNKIALAKGTWDMMQAPPPNPLDPPAVTRLPDIHAPTLVIAGGLDHPEILRAAELMAASMPNASKAIIPDCAHLPNMEKPEEFNRLVLDFLRSIG
ncbi:MAG: alpha/beta fold hydrolase [Anaerolineales bacterium]